MPYIWLNLLIQYFALSYIFQNGHLENTTFNTEPFIGPMNYSSSLSKHKFWEFFKTSEITSINSKPMTSQTNSDLSHRKPTDLQNFTTETVEEDLLSIRDLDNLIVYSNTSFEHENFTTSLENTSDVYPNLDDAFKRTNAEVQKLNLNVTHVNKSKQHIDLVKSNYSDKFDQLVQNITSRYLSKFVVGEESEVSREETDDLVEKGTTSGTEGKPETEGWPVKHAAEVPGDLILGGLMMVHEREDSVTCGPIMPQGGIQALETMLYTLDVINSQPQRPFTLGAHILDDCDKDTYGLEMAVDFIKGKIDQLF